MTATVVIGRKELFAFADRYSSQRLRDYGGLADGAVLCELFSLVFPTCAIRPASPQTHSTTQRTLLNWEGLFRGFARLHIPLALLDPVAIARGDAEKGFSTLVLFYFLFHLSKRTDFSAEFAMDVTEELTTFLQSIDSIASLLLGEVVEWDSIPEELGDTIRQQPSFHVTPAEQDALEEAAAKRCRAILAPAAAVASFSRSSSGGPARKRESRASARGGHRMEPTPPPPVTLHLSSSSARTEDARTPDTVSAKSTPPRSAAHAKGGEVGAAARRTDVRPTPVEPLSSLRAPPPPGERRRVSEGPQPEAARETSVASTVSASLPSSSTAAPRLGDGGDPSFRRRYVEKAKECEGLRGSNIQLLAQVASLEAELAHARSRQTAAESRVVELTETVNTLATERERAMKAEQQLFSRGRTDGAARAEGDAETDAAVMALLDDVTDPNTGAPLNAHELANLLHCTLLEHMQDSPINRGHAQSWLWSIVTAYHVLETRLVDAVDVIDRLQYQQQGCTQQKGVESHPHGETTALTGGAVSPIDHHHTEHELRRSLARASAALARTTTRAGEREKVWRRLCAALHRAEQLSRAAGECIEEHELEQLLADRSECYAEVEELTAELATGRAGAAEGSLELDSASDKLDAACGAVRALAEEAMRAKTAAEEENTELRRMLAEATERLRQPPPSTNGARTMDRPHSSPHTAWASASSRSTASASPPLTTPPPLAQLSSSNSRSSGGAQTIPAAFDRRSSRSPAGPGSSPYGKNLAALLAEATSPYDRIVADALASE